MNRNLLGLLGAALLTASPVYAAQELLAIQISGVAGDTTFATANGIPPNSIQVFSSSIGLSTQVSSSGGSGLNVSKPNFLDLAIQKRFDNSSPALALDEMIGKSINSIVLSFYTGTPGAFVRYYTITLTNSYVSSIGVANSAGSDGASETVSFFYQRIRYLDNLTGATACFDRTTLLTC
jgi:type VI secretion system Hcp family effector